MTFAEELQHAISVQPVIDSAVNETRVLKKRETDVTVYGIAQGFDLLYDLCVSKDVFRRPFWADMDIPGKTDREELEAFVNLNCPDPNQTAIWTNGRFCSLLVRINNMLCHYVFLVGHLTMPERRDLLRALFDVGIKELRYESDDKNPYQNALATSPEYKHQQLRRQNHWTTFTRPINERPE